MAKVDKKTELVVQFKGAEELTTNFTTKAMEYIIVRPGID